MPRTLSPVETRGLVIDHVERLEALPTFQEPTEEMYNSLIRMHDNDKQRAYSVVRGKRQVSVDLNMTIGQFEDLFIGKSVLDIGCSIGVLSRELSKLKKTSVTALDIDPEMLAHIKEGPSIKTVEGSAFDLNAAVGDEKYDVTISSYSATFWARNEQQKRGSILSQLGVTATDGLAIWVPILAEIGHREYLMEGVQAAKENGDEKLHVSGAIGSMPILDIEAALIAADWLDVAGIDTLLQNEEARQIDCSFVSSRDNALARALIKDRFGKPLSTQEHYSVLARVLEDQNT